MTGNTSCWDCSAVYPMAFSKCPECGAVNANHYMKQQCPHGKQLHECDACYVAADFAFDAAREDRMFGHGR